MAVLVRREVFQEYSFKDVCIEGNISTIVRANLDGVQHSIWGIHGVHGVARTAFWNAVRERSEEILRAEDRLKIIGDLNVCQNRELDRDCGTRGAEVLAYNSLLEGSPADYSPQLVDIWRRLNPSKIAYTFVRSTWQGDQRSRIDAALVDPLTAKDLVFSCRILPFKHLSPDHAPIALSLLKAPKDPEVQQESTKPRVNQSGFKSQERRRNFKEKLEQLVRATPGPMIWSQMRDLIWSAVNAYKSVGLKQERPRGPLFEPSEEAKSMSKVMRHINRTLIERQTTRVSQPK